MKKLLIAGSLIGDQAFAAEGYKVLSKIKIGGTGGWDYIAVDPATRTASTLRTARWWRWWTPTPARWWGRSPQLHGVHGVAVAPEFGKGFITNGQSNSVTIFDLKTLAKVGEPQTGQNPDSVCFEPKTKHIFTFNGRSNDSTAIDPKTNEVIKTFPLGGKPEECAPDGTGKIYVNLEDTSEIIEIDAAKTTVTRHASLVSVRQPQRAWPSTRKNKKLFSVCDNKMMVVTDIPTLKVIATPPIGAGPDGAGLRCRARAGLQLQRQRWNAEHREAGERQV